MKTSKTLLGFMFGAALAAGCSNGASTASDTDGEGPQNELADAAQQDGPAGDDSESDTSDTLGGVQPGGSAQGSSAENADVLIIADSSSNAPQDPESVGMAAPNGGVVAIDGNSTTVVSPETEQETSAPDSREFDAVGTNPFVMVAHDPLSTFAADVDTASYDIFRKDVAAGRLPPAASIRLEEFVNFFDYDYPAPADDAAEPFSINLAAAPNFIDNGTTLLRVGIQGQVLADDGRKAMNLVFLVDTSGSMRSADKLPLVQRLLTDSLDLLSPADTVSIVTYAGSTGVALPPTEATERETIKLAIQQFSAGGSTAGAAGLELAYEQAESVFIEGGVNHVILCTDGDFNVGISDNDELVAFIEEKRETGVTFTALGFGSGNLDDAKMEALSNAGNGTYAVITDEQYAHDYVTDRLFSSLQFIAKDMKLQVEFNPEHVLAYRLLGYENRAIADEDFRVDTVDAGEIGSGHRVTALYELVLSGGDVPMPEGAEAPEDGAPFDGTPEVAAEDLVLVKVRYKDVDAKAEDAAYEVSQGLAQELVAPSPSDLDDDFRWAVAIASFAEILKESPYANPSLSGQLSAVFQAQASRDPEREAFAALYDAALDMLDLPAAPPESDAGVTPKEDDDSASDAGVLGDAG